MGTHYGTSVHIALFSPTRTPMTGLEATDGLSLTLFFEFIPTEFAGQCC